MVCHLPPSCYLKSERKILLNFSGVNILVSNLKGMVPKLVQEEGRVDLIIPLKIEVELVSKEGLAIY